MHLPALNELVADMHIIYVARRKACVCYVTTQVLGILRQCLEHMHMSVRHQRGKDQRRQADIAAWKYGSPALPCIFMARLGRVASIELVDIRPLIPRRADARLAASVRVARLNSFRQPQNPADFTSSATPPAVA